MREKYALQKQRSNDSNSIKDFDIARIVWVKPLFTYSNRSSDLPNNFTISERCTKILKSNISIYCYWL